MTGVRAPPARCRPSLLSRSVASRRESGGGRGVLPAFGEMLCERVMVGEKCRHAAGVENEDLVLFGSAAGGGGAAAPSSSPRAVHQWVKFSWHSLRLRLTLIPMTGEAIPWLRNVNSSAVKIPPV